MHSGCQRTSSTFRSGFPDGRHVEPVGLTNGGLARLDKVEREVRLGRIVADLVVTCASRPLIVEINVTHEVGRYKLRQIRKLGLPAIELSIYWKQIFDPPDDLIQSIRNGDSNKIWLYHPRQRESQLEQLKRVRTARQQARLERPRIWHVRPRGNPVPLYQIDRFHQRWSRKKREAYGRWLRAFEKRQHELPSIADSEVWLNEWTTANERSESR